MNININNKMIIIYGYKLTDNEKDIFVDYEDPDESPVCRYHMTNYSILFTSGDLNDNVYIGKIITESYEYKLDFNIFNIGDDTIQNMFQLKLEYKLQNLPHFYFLAHYNPLFPKSYIH